MRTVIQSFWGKEEEELGRERGPKLHRFLVTVGGRHEEGDGDERIREMDKRWRTGTCIQKV